MNIAERKAFYNGRAWRKLSQDVMHEQHYECQMCKAKGIYTRARLVHHVLYLEHRPDLCMRKYYVDSEGNKQRQLLCLCQQCHEEIHERCTYSDKKEQLNVEQW